MGVTPCSGGNAQPIPGSQTNTAITAAAVESALALLGLEPVALVLAPLLAGVVVDLQNLCSQDPPADPGLTAQDLLDVLNFADPFVSVPALAKAKQWFLSWYWYFACRCVSGPTPNAPAPSNPGGVGTSTGLPTGIAGSPCWSVAPRLSFPQQTTQGFFDESAAFFPAAQLLPVVPPFTGAPNTAPAIPPGVTNVHLDGVVVSQGVTGLNTTFRTYDATGNIKQQFFVTDEHATPGIHSIFDFTPAAGAVAWNVLTTHGLNDAPSTEAFTFSYFCGSPNAPVTPCCPPDPLLEGMLSRIIEMVTLIQRQSAPFAYVPGTTHAGLTGVGVVTVQGLIGVKISPTAFPQGIGVEVGDPDSLWLDSWIRWGNADGWAQREFLTAAPFVSLPAAAGQYTRVGYTLRPGLVADVVELRREP